MSTVIHVLTVRIITWCMTHPRPRRPRLGPRFRRRDDRGQATAEYALVLLGAALVALLLIAWATTGGGAGKIGRLFDRVLDTITGKVT